MPTDQLDFDPVFMGFLKLEGQRADDCLPMPDRSNNRWIKRSSRRRHSVSALADDESGVMLVEVIISAMLLALIAGAVFTTLTSTSRAGAEQRSKAQAYAIAQKDQARLRALSPTTLSRLSQTSTVTQGTTTFTVTSTGTPRIDRQTTVTCESGNTSSDYIEISSSVTWPALGTRPPMVIESIVAPFPGTLAADRGALAVSVVNSAGLPFPGVTISGNGAGTFSGVTDDNGCVIFGDLLAGNYNVTPAAAGVVDPNGNAPAPKATSVVGQASNSVSFQYDQPGGFRVGFQTIKSGTIVSSSQGDTIRISQAGMTASKGFGTVSSANPAVRTNSVSTGKTLFPFTSPYSIWAGSCDSNNPGDRYGTYPAAANVPYAEYTVPVNRTPPTSAEDVQLTLPALNLTVYRGTASAPGALASSTTTVRIRDRDCSVGGNLVQRTLRLNGTTGKLADPGLPWSDYHVCVRGASDASTAAPNPSTNMRWVNVNDVEVENPADPTDLTIYLRDAPAANTGNCPA